MNLMRYLLEANLYLVVFYLLYVLLLRKETYYQLSRAYLLVASALAFVIPLLQLGILKPTVETFTSVAVAPNITFGDMQAIPAPVLVAEAPAPTWTAFDYFLLAYGLITLGLIINLSFKIFKLVKLSKSNVSTSTDDFVLVEIEDENAAFSFFRYLFIDRKLASSATVIHHEQVHIRQKHSWDIIYLEVLKVINWFNPFVYLLQNSIKEVHEFIADEQTAAMENSNDTYAEFLISNAYGMAQGALTNSFSGKNMLRKRIIMLYQKRSGKLATLKYLLALPLVCGLLCLSTMAFTDKSYALVDILPQHSQTLQHKLHTSFSYKNSSPATAKQNTLQLQKAMDVLKDAGDDAGDISAQQVVNDTVVVANKKQPLVVLDGKVLNPKVNNKFNFNSADQKDYTELLGGISPNDIKDITVLKDSSATALYGSAGVNGVLIINTKKRIDEAMAKEVDIAIKRELSAAVKRDTNNTKVFTAVEVEPTPKGGLDDFYQFLSKNIRYPEEDKKNNVQGRVIVQFIVEKDGGFSDIKVLRTPSATTGDEALRVLNIAPKWNPGIQNGRPVRVQYTIPINFSLADVDSFGAFYKQLIEKIKYPAEAKEKNNGGRMLVTFSLDADKQIKDVKILRGYSKVLDDEVIRNVQSCKNLPNGKPGTTYVLPVFFELKGSDGKNIGTTQKDKDYVDTPKQTTIGYVPLSQIVVTAYK